MYDVCDDAFRLAIRPHVVNVDLLKEEREKKQLPNDLIISCIRSVCLVRCVCVCLCIVGILRSF